MLRAVAAARDKGVIVKPIQTAAILLVVAVAWHAPSAGAQATTTITPMTVDAVNVRYGAIDVTGVEQGSTTITRHTFSPTYVNTDAAKSAALDRCHRSLLLALSKPGQYVARIGTDSCSIALATP